MRCVFPLVAWFALSLCARAQSDSFQEATLDSCRWWIYPTNSGSQQMNNGLVLTSNSAQPYSDALVYSQYYAPGDFDVQVDYQLDSSWNAPMVPSGSNPTYVGAQFSAYMDGQSILALSRLRTQNSNQLELYGTPEGQTVYAAIPSTDMSGSLRISRTANLMQFMAFTSGAWTVIGSWTGTVRPVVFGLGSANVNTLNAVTTTFQNFAVNSGQTNFEPYQLPTTILTRPDFAPGFVSADSLTESVWGYAPGYNPFPILSSNGMSLARIRITTVSDPALESTPFSQWSTLPWNSDYWASLQMGTQELLQAGSLGWQKYLELFLSDGPYSQNAPAAWQGLSQAETAAQLQAYTYATVSGLKAQGIDIDLYSPGSEIQLGIDGFVPGQLLPAPQGSSAYEDIDFMEENVWPVEAQLLNAAITGIRQADPTAKIVLHVAGLESSPANIWIKAFFATMIDQGVPFDVAGLSLPYMSSNWTLPQYSTSCWFQKVDAVLRDIAYLGKKAIVSESAYPGLTTNLSANNPMQDFPITPQGQAAWVDANLVFGSNNPNLMGFNYFYPEWFPGFGGPNPPTDLEANGLFYNASTIRPGLQQFLPFLNTVKKPQIGSVVNSENSQTESLVPGQYAVVNGQNLAGFTMTAQLTPYPPVLADVSVVLNGQTVPIQSVGPTQIVFQVPDSTAAGPGTIEVSAGLQDSLPFVVHIQSNPASLVTSPPTLAFNYTIGGTVSPAQSISVTSSTSTVLLWTVTSSVPWLTVSPASGSTPGAISVSLTTTGLMAGSSTGVVTVASSGVTSQLVNVSLTVSPAAPVGPQISAGGVFNAATLQTGGIAPNEFITLKGTGLGLSTGVSSGMSTQLGGSSVYIGGTAAYLNYAQDGQINVLVPFNVSGLSTTTIQVQYNGVTGNSVTVPVVASSPGVFTQSYGPGQAWVANQDQSFNSASNPAARGTYIAFWLTGQGLLNATIADGTQPTGPPFPTPLLPVSVTLGGVTVPAANLAFDGLVYSGEVQINLLIPDNAPTGSAIPLVVTIGGASSRSDATLAIQ